MSYSTSNLGLPWVQWPLISNAPMSGFAGSQLAVAVTQAGGLGQIGFMTNLEAFDEELTKTRNQLGLANHQNGTDSVLPISIGIIIFATVVDAFIPLITKHRPAVVWLAFGTDEEFAEWAVAIRKASPQTKVWIQIGSIEAAVGVARASQPDALVLQGVDAGGHGLARGSASIVSLVPEAADTLSAAGFGDLPLIAAGGIMDGRGTAAALTLGAAGVVLGTRFLAAEEALTTAPYRAAVLGASDGGKATGRSRIFDEMLNSNNIWPDIYDGRALANVIFEHVQSGLSFDEAREKLRLLLEGVEGEDFSFKDRQAVWAGTGVGLLDKTEKAADIVTDVRKAALKQLKIFGDLASKSNM